MARDSAVARVLLVTLAIHVTLVAAILLVKRDPVWFVHFGSSDPASAHAHAALGGRADNGPYGHDGQVFWALAHDPFLVHPDRVAVDLDRPVYRAQRVLYPVLVSPWLLVNESALLWGMVLTNLAVVAIGGYFTARLAARIGAPARAAVAFALNPLTLVAVAMDFADALALSLLVAAVLALRHDRWRWAIAAATAATLAKESSLFAVMGVAALAPALPRPRRAWLATIPAAGALVWGLYVRWRFGRAGTGVQELTAIPFQGYATLMRDYYPANTSIPDVAVAFALVAVAVAIAARWWRRRTIEMAAALPYALVVPFLTGPVLYLSINAVRAIGPAITFVVLDAYVSPRLAAPAAAR